MRMKAEQAKLLLCPIMSQKQTIRCATTDCMAWRWNDMGFVSVRTPAGMQPKGEGWRRISHRDGWILWTRSKRDEERVGSCGLADKADGRYVVWNDPTMGDKLPDEDMEPIES
jgi:hypothetical protein